MSNSSNLIGRVLGQYTIVELIGEGGMASVFRARQTSIDRDVAIKIVHANLFSGGIADRFTQEARTVAQLDHPHILKVFDFGQQDGIAYLVMELKTGGNLAEFRKSVALPLDQTARLLDQIAGALDYAHRRQIIHRDMKPANVLLDADQNAFLTDFGIAKLLNESKGLTQTGMSIGTPYYMSPEQWEGRAIDHRSDIYALGVMLYEMLTGQKPFDGETTASIMFQHFKGEIPDASAIRADLSPAVDAVIKKALSKDINERFNRASDLSASFQQALFDETFEDNPEDVSVPLQTATQRAKIKTGPQPAKVRTGPQSQVNLVPDPNASVSESGGRNRMFILAGVGSVVALAVIIGLVAGRGGGDKSGGAGGDGTRTPVSTVGVGLLSSNSPATIVATSTPEATKTGVTLVAQLPATVAATLTPTTFPTTPAPSATIKPTTLLPTVTPIPPSATLTNTVRPSVTPIPPTATPIPPSPTPIIIILTATPPSATLTYTSLPPSATLTRTNTSIPPTSTPIPPSATLTRTNTPIPPTLTPTPTPTQPPPTFTPTVKPSETPIPPSVTPSKAPPTAAAALVTRRIAYLARAENGRPQIFTAKVDGGDVRQLTNTTDTYLAPLSWSPDGKQIAFTVRTNTSQSVWVMDSDGNNPARYATGSYPTFSPDGSQIAFIGSQAGRDEVFLMNADGSAIRALKTGGIRSTFVAWSPDGQELAFLSSGLLVIGVNDGDQPRRLTADNRVLLAVWSPDGKSLAYTAGTLLFTTKSDGSEPPRQIVANASAPAWSPLGNKIAYVSVGAIYVADVDGTNPVKLASGSDPAWSPDGSRLSYVANGSLFTVKVDGGDVQPLAKNASGASWSPH